MHSIYEFGNRMHKRQVTTTVTRRRATTTTAASLETPLAQVAAATTSAAIGRSGIANTGTGTRPAPTAPPTRARTIESGTYSFTFATRASGYSGAAIVPAHPASSGGASSIGGSAVNGNSSASSSTASTTGLSKTALIGIIAGGSALVVIIAVVVGCCCRKRKKAKKDAAWKQLNESQSSIAAYNLGQRDPSVAALGSSDDHWSRQTATPSREKTWSGAWDGDEKSAAQERSHQYQYPPQQRQQSQQESQQQQQQNRQQQQQHQYAFAVQEQQNLVAARAELFSGRRAQSVGSEMNNDVISFGGHHTPSVQDPPSRNLTDMTTYSSNSLATTAAATDRQMPMPNHSWRPSEVPVGAFAPPLSRDERRQVQDRDDQVEDRFRQVITGAVGRPNSVAAAAECRQRGAQDVEAQQAAREQETSQAEEKRNQEALRRKKDTIANLADAYGGNDDSSWPEDKPASVPKRTASRRKTNGLGAESAPPSTSVTRRQPTAARYSSRVDSKPLRELEDILDSFHNDTTDSRNGLPPLPSGSSSGGSSGSGSSQRTESVLSGLSSNGRFHTGRYNGVNSMSSSLADYSSMRNQPTQLATVVETSHQPLRLVQNASLGEQHSRDNSPLQSTPPLESPVRDRMQAPMSLEDSPTSSEVPSWGHSAGPSPATTPLTPQFNSASPWDCAGEALVQQRQQQQAPSRKQQAVINHGFEPLSSLAPDNSYRSATLSIYGMYDDDDAPELKGLPMDDPRVSRHLQSQGAPRVMV